MSTHHNDHRHGRRPRSKGLQPVYLSRAQRIHLARRLRNVLARLREASADSWMPVEMLRETTDEIRMVRSILGRLRDARTDG